MNNFTKADLKTGYILTTRCGQRYMVMLNAEMTNMYEPADIVINLNGNGWNRLEFYNDDLTHNTRNEMFVWEQDDFIKVERPANPTGITVKDSVLARCEVLWEREVPKEMTIAEIEEALGHPVKIVKEK